MFNQDRSQLRQFFFDCWKKYQQQQALEPLEKQIIAVILDHPEYISLFEQSDENLLDKDFHLDEKENPFLHLGLHLSLREQISTNRPNGIKTVYEKLFLKMGSKLAVEHIMLDVLRDCLWEFRSSGKFPSDEIYLRRLQLLVE